MIRENADSRFCAADGATGGRGSGGAMGLAGLGDGGAPGRERSGDRMVEVAVLGRGDAAFGTQWG
jgi:hypothetical protein